MYPEIPTDPRKRQELERALQDLPPGKTVQYRDVKFTKLTLEQAGTIGRGEHQADIQGSILASFLLAIPGAALAEGAGLLAGTATGMGFGILGSAVSTNSSFTVRGGDVVCEDHHVVHHMDRYGTLWDSVESRYVVYGEDEGGLAVRGLRVDPDFSQ